MSGNGYPTSNNLAGRLASSIPRSAASKRDSLAAELERDPQLNATKRKQRTQAFASHMTQSSLERQLAAAQTAKTELETKLREKDTIIERLEGDRRFLAEREEEERIEKERERAERDEEKRKADADLRAVRNLYTTLREQYADLEEGHSSLSRSSASTIATQKAEISTLTHQVAILQEELAEFKRIAEERSQAFEELQAQFEDLSLAQNDTSRSMVDDENWTVIRDELHRQASHLKKVEGENAKMSAELNTLRQRHANTEVLKEQKRELERKLSGMDELRERVVKLEAELDAARKEREEWASKATKPSQTPVSVTQSLSNLRLTYARLLEEHGSNVAILRRREAELAESERKVQEAQRDAEKLQNEILLLKDKARRQENRAQLAEREVGYLQAMVASFEAEDVSQTQDGVSVTRVGSDETIFGRIQDLEKLIAEYKDTVVQMEKEIEDLGGDPSTLGTSRPRNELLQELDAERSSRVEAQKALAEAESENEKHLEKIEDLEQTLFELQGEIGGGRHVPPGVRVLSLAQNPFQEWQDLSKAAMDRLRSENEALLKRLKDLEENGVITGSGSPPNPNEVVPKESYDAVNQEKEELEQELKQKEKRLLRLKQVFSTKTDEFKEAIASILGVKLAFFPNGTVRVTSLYDLSAVFAFQPSNTNGENQMQLVGKGDGGPEDLPQLQRYWVEQEGSIPGFMASVTLECYEKWKNEQLREQT